MAEVPIVSAGKSEAKTTSTPGSLPAPGIRPKDRAPRPGPIAAAVRHVFADPAYKTSLAGVAAQLRAQRPLDTMAETILKGVHERGLAVPGNTGPRAS